MDVDSEFISGLIAEAKIDEVGLWFIIAELQREKGIRDPSKLQATTLEVCKILLESGEIAARLYATGSIAEAPPEDILSYIRAEWDELGRVPNIGEIVDFVNRPKQG